MSQVIVGELKHSSVGVWRIEASPRKRYDAMVKEANQKLKKLGVTDPKWTERTIGHDVFGKKLAQDKAEREEAESAESAA